MPLIMFTLGTPFECFRNQFQYHLTCRRGVYSGPGFSPIQVSYDLTIDSLNGMDSVTLDLQGIMSKTQPHLKGQNAFEIPEPGLHLIIRGLTITNAGWVCYNVEGSNVTFDSCRITHSGDEGSGSAIQIQLQSFLMINNSIFENNHAATGGVINLQSGSANITNSVFFNNSADQAGGAISIQEGTLNIVNCTFHSNWAIQGGAIDVDAQDTLLNINDTEFVNNRAGAGGAVSFSSNSYGSFNNWYDPHIILQDHSILFISSDRIVQ